MDEKNFTIVDECQIYNDIKEIVMKRVTAMKNANSVDLRDLFSLARIYAVLKDDIREDIKYDTFARLGISVVEKSPRE